MNTGPKACRLAGPPDSMTKPSRAQRHLESPHCVASWSLGKLEETSFPTWRGREPGGDGGGEKSGAPRVPGGSEGGERHCRRADKARSTNLNFACTMVPGLHSGTAQPCGNCTVFWRSAQLTEKRSIGDGQNHALLCVRACMYPSCMPFPVGSLASQFCRYECEVFHAGTYSMSGPAHAIC